MSAREYCVRCELMKILYNHLNIHIMYNVINDTASCSVSMYINISYNILYYMICMCNLLVFVYAVQGRLSDVSEWILPVLQQYEKKIYILNTYVHSVTECLRKCMCVYMQPVMDVCVCVLPCAYSFVWHHIITYNYAIASNRVYVQHFFLCTLFTLFFSILL